MIKIPDHVTKISDTVVRINFRRAQLKAQLMDFRDELFERREQLTESLDYRTYRSDEKYTKEHLEAYKEFFKYQWGKVPYLDDGNVFELIHHILDISMDEVFEFVQDFLSFNFLPDGIGYPPPVFC